jgi:hypothetical protein
MEGNDPLVTSTKRRSPTFHERTCEDCGTLYTPSGVRQRYCDSCRRDHRATARSHRRRQARAADKHLVFAHYGTSCACCGTTEDLTIDHVNGDGRAHREEIGGAGHALYAWLVKNDFPTGFQVLCMLCNASKHKGDHCRIHAPVCPTCQHPLDEGFVLTSRTRRSSAHLVAVPKSQLFPQ